MTIALGAVMAIAVGGWFASRRTVFKPNARDLELAIRQGDKARVADLIAQGADVRAPMKRAELDLAASSPDTSLVAFLLEKGADPNQQGEGGLPLRRAAIQNRVDLMEALLRGGARIDLVGEGGSALQGAIEYCQMDALRFLLGYGAKKLSWVMYEFDRKQVCKACREALQLGATPTLCDGLRQ